MNELKAYQSPNLLFLRVNSEDLLTVSPNDNNAEWDPKWNGIISV